MSLLREAERCVANQKAFACLNAFITPLQRAGPWLDSVREADTRREHGFSKSALDGRLIAIKDNICTRSLPTTCASGILDKFSSPFDATVVKDLQNFGAIVAGKTNLDEFGMGSHSIHSRFGPVKSSPVNSDEGPRSAGGSSGGSAVAVMTDQCYAALGTDTGGSVRLPAAYTGAVGFKPSYGLISRWGVVAYANSLDTVGIMGKNVSIIRETFELLSRHDRRDPTNLSSHSRSRLSSYFTNQEHSKRFTSRPLRIGVPIEYNLSELTQSVRNAWLSSLTHLEKEGHSLYSVSLPSTKLALSAYYILAPAEASSNLAKYDGVRYGTRAEGPDGHDGPDGYLYANTRGQGFGPEVRRRILLGSFSLSADAIDNYFIQAQRVRRLVQEDFDQVFAVQNLLKSSSVVPDRNEPTVDVLICPTAPSTPPTLASVLENSSNSSSTDSSLAAYISDVFTVPASLAGLPAISVPVSVPKSQETDSSDLDTVGMQVIGQYGDDDLVLKVGEILEHNIFAA